MTNSTFEDLNVVGIALRFYFSCILSGSFAAAVRGYLP